VRVYCVHSVHSLHAVCTLYARTAPPAHTYLASDTARGPKWNLDMVWISGDGIPGTSLSFCFGSHSHTRPCQDRETGRDGPALTHPTGPTQGQVRRPLVGNPGAFCDTRFCAWKMSVMVLTCLEQVGFLNYQGMLVIR
jgi:hypothetical protein